MAVDTWSPLYLPSPASLLVVVALVLAATPAAAADRDWPLLGRGLPDGLAPAAEHVPSPWPEDEAPKYQGGTSGWVAGAGVLTASAAVLGGVAASQAVRLKNEPDPSKAASMRKVRNGAAYGSVGLLGGAGLCLVFNRVL